MGYAGEGPPAAGERLVRIVTGGPVLVISAPLQGDSYCTPNVRRLLGYEPDWLLEHWRELVHPADRDDLLTARAQAIATGAAEQILRIRHADGRWLAHQTCITVEQDEDSAGDLVIYALDVSHQEDLDQHTRQAQKLEAVATLAGGIAHDFNNILTVIRGYVELAAMEQPSPELEEALAGVESARDLVEHLLAFSREHPMELEPVDVNDLLRRALDTVQPLTEPDIPVTSALAADLPPVQADRDLLEQAVLNLLLNACDAMPEGGTLTVTTDALADLGMVRLRVTDTGVGMAPDVVGRAFDPFFTTKEPGRGTGLGLSTVYGAVNAAGGSVTVDSVPGSGSTFTVLLPPATEDPATLTASGVEAGEASGVVLLVEDQDQIRMLLERVLHQAGFRVLSASDGAAALRTAAGRHIDLLLTDVAMPGMRGPQLAAALRADRPDLRVLFMSGYSPETLPLDERSTFLQKPFSPGELLAHAVAAME